MKRFDRKLDAVADNAQLVRRFGDLENDELGRRWVEALGATLTRPDDENARLLQEDLFAEHQLRRIKPPYEQVSAQRDRLVAEVVAKLQELKLLKRAAMTIAQAHPHSAGNCTRH